MCELLVLETCERAPENLETFNSYSQKPRGQIPPPLRPSVICYNVSSDLSINRQYALIRYNCDYKKKNFYGPAFHPTDQWPMWSIKFWRPIWPMTHGPIVSSGPTCRDYLNVSSASGLWSSRCLSICAHRLASSIGLTLLYFGWYHKFSYACIWLA